MRPRFNESEAEQYKLKQFWDKKLYKVLFFSDPHGWLADLAPLRCINQILQHNKFDEVCINGDLVDLPFLSRHPQKLYQEGILKDYTEVKEIDYTYEQILKPLRASTDAKVRVRVGNHDERITKPNMLGDNQLKRLAILYKHFETTKFEEMLRLKSLDFTYDDSDMYSYFDIFNVVHGLSLAKNASEKNIYEYMSSGATGHTHRANSKFFTTQRGPYVWFELGCTRLLKQVEYFPTAKTADWQHAFVVVNFINDGGKPKFYGTAHCIVDGRVCYNGILYNGNG